MGFLDRFKKKEPQSTETQQKEPGQPSAGKRIKKYTSEGKPVYE